MKEVVLFFGFKYCKILCALYDTRNVVSMCLCQTEASTFWGMPRIMDGEVCPTVILWWALFWANCLDGVSIFRPTTNCPTKLSIWIQTQIVTRGSYS